MLFNSLGFILLFLPISLIGFYLAARAGRVPAAVWLIAVSLLFYAQWNASFVFLLMASVAFNFAVSELVGALKRRPALQSACLLLGIGANLAVLVYYKYCTALIQFAVGLGASDLHVPSIVLPLGISFFTFTQIGFLVDVRSGTAKNRGLLNYVLFVTFFPHLIAGPILHNREIMPQFESPATYRVSGKNFAVGLSLFIMGLGKKCLLADPLSDAVGVGFQTAAYSPMFSAWYTALSYSLQLYFDFSGYSDMAIGLAQMFNIQFPINFNSPYKATSVIDFWQRWHITLTRYLTLYVYGPLALTVTRWRSNRGLSIARSAQSSASGFATMVALPIFVTMILAGIWHGAGLQFLVFGLLHSAFLTINHAWRLSIGRRNKMPERRLGLVASFLLTFLSMLVARVFFRAESVRAAMNLLSGMLGLHGIGSIPLPGSVVGWLGHWGNALVTHNIVSETRPMDFVNASAQTLWLLLLYVAVLSLPNTQQVLSRFQSFTTAGRRRSSAWLLWEPSTGWAVALGILAAISLAAVGGTSEFLYFQF